MTYVSVYSRALQFVNIVLYFMNWLLTTVMNVEICVAFEYAGSKWSLNYCGLSSDVIVHYTSENA